MFVQKHAGRVLALTRQHTNGFPLLKYLDSLVHLYKPAESLGLAVPALRNEILQAPRNGILQAFPVG